MNSEPAWCETFLANMRERARRHGRCDVKLASQLAGVNRVWVYRYRKSRHGEAFRMEWDRIVLEAQQIHSSRHSRA